MKASTILEQKIINSILEKPLISKKEFRIFEKIYRRIARRQERIRLGIENFEFKELTNNLK